MDKIILILINYQIYASLHHIIKYCAKMCIMSAHSIDRTNPYFPLLFSRKNPSMVNEPRIYDYENLKCCQSFWYYMHFIYTSSLWFFLLCIKTKNKNGPLCVSIVQLRTSLYIVNISEVCKKYLVIVIEINIIFFFLFSSISLVNIYPYW